MLNAQKMHRMLNVEEMQQMLKKGVDKMWTLCAAAAHWDAALAWKQAAAEAACVNQQERNAAVSSSSSSSHVFLAEQTATE